MWKHTGRVLGHRQGCAERPPAVCCPPGCQKRHDAHCTWRVVHRLLLSPRALAWQLVWCDDRGCGGVAQFKRVAFRHATIVAKLREAEATIARLQAAHADSGDAGGVTSNNNAPPAPPPALPKARLRIATEEPVLLPSPRLAPQQSEQARQLHRSVSPITAGTDSPMLSPRRLSPRRKKVSGV